MYTECQFLNRIDRIYYFILYVPFKLTSPLKIVFHSTLSLNHPFSFSFFGSFPVLIYILFVSQPVLLTLSNLAPSDYIPAFQLVI